MGAFLGWYPRNWRRQKQGVVFYDFQKQARRNTTVGLLNILDYLGIVIFVYKSPKILKY
jgi:hypothetical protein